jgi:hypothetical protein
VPVTTDTYSASAERSGPEAPPPNRGPRGRVADVAAVVGFSLAALYVMADLWRRGARAQFANNAGDFWLLQWMAAHGARVVTHLENPFFTDRLNVPDGVNLLANTSVLALTIPFAPVTAAFGPAVTVKLLTTLGLAGTAIAWYFVLSRRIVGSRAAAAIGAGFAAFAPGMISQATGHLHLSFQVLVPIIVWRVLALREPGRALRNGVGLGVLIALQAFISEEVLLFTAITLGGVVILVAVLRPDLRRDARPFLAGLGVAAATAAILLAYPLWLQFFGPQSYRGLPSVQGYTTDVAALFAFSGESLTGSINGLKPNLALNPSEETSFFGWPLVVLLVGLVWWRRRDRVVLALAAMGSLLLLLSLGPTVTVMGRSTGIPGPWRLLRHLPIADSVVSTRFALGVIPLIAIVLARAYVVVSRAAGDVAARTGGEGGRPLLVVWHLALLAALVPILPTPIRAIEHSPTPEFLAGGIWRQYVDDRHTMLTVPPPRDPTAQRWSAETGLDLRIPLGYILSPMWNPGHPEHGMGIFTGRARPTSDLLFDVHDTGRVPSIAADDRRQAVQDLRHWQASVVVLDPTEERERELRQVTTDLLGAQPALIGGLWVWDVRALTA